MSDKTAPARPAPRLYLATQMVTDPAPLAASLPAILGSADVAAVLVRLKETDPRSMITTVKALGLIPPPGESLSVSMNVPAGVPSLLQSSAPLTPSLAVK